LGEILVAQTNLLGGSLTNEWGAPPPDASPTIKQIFIDYCATRSEIMSSFNDDLAYLPPTPCPS